MSEESKHKKTSLSGFIRYHGDKMPDKERNAFERELQKDPFAEEASEGFETIASEEAEKDISAISKRLRGRVTRRERFTYYRIAASVAVLMVISSVFVILQRGKPDKRSFDTSAGQEELLITEAKPVVRMDKEPDKPEQLSPQLRPGPEQNRAEQEVPAVAERSVPGEKEPPAMAKAADSQPEMQEKRAAMYLTNDQLASPVAAMAPAGKDAGDEQISRSDSVREEQIAGFIPARPLTGIDSFNKYLYDKLKRPDTISPGQRVVVVLELKVLADGTIDSIRIVRSPDKRFSDEAIRLIREGPVWKPAEHNGVKTDDKASVRIVFR